MREVCFKRICAASSLEVALTSATAEQDDVGVTNHT